MPSDAMSKIDGLKPTFGAKYRTEVVSRLLASHEQMVKAIPYASYETVMSIPRPVCISGQPHTGKSVTLRVLLKRAMKNNIPLICFDPMNDHPYIPKPMSYAEFLAFAWSGRSAYRVTYNRDDSIRKVEFTETLKALEREMKEYKTKPFLLAFEEAYEFYDHRPFLKLLAKIRKFARHTIIVSVDYEPFKSFCAQVRPLPEALSKEPVRNTHPSPNV